MWTITGLRLRRDRRGVSNVIVVVLSLVIIIAITSNVVLWSYQMNQLDWEKIKESTMITNVVRVTSSSWFTVESEYTVGKGSLVSGDYTDTQAVDSSNETFREASIPQQETIHPNDAGKYAQWGSLYPPAKVAHWECCQEDPPDDDESYVETNKATWKYEAYELENQTGSGTINWVRVYVRVKLTSAGTSSFRTLVRTHDTDYESSDITISTSYQNNYTQYDTNPNTGLAWTWDEIDSLQAGASAKISGTANIRMTAVWVVIHYSPPQGYELNLNGRFTIDLSTYPPAYIKTVEIQLRYRADDAGEKWYLRAYNWTAETYSDSFNSTTGYTPTTGWDYYSVNLTNQWSNYVQDNGTVYVKIVEQGADDTQTTIDIDFLGVRVAIDGTRFTFKNDGSLTSHLVSLWIINSTNHERYDTNVIANSGETLNYTRADISLPSGQYMVKVVTERGNIAVYSGS